MLNYFIYRQRDINNFIETLIGTVFCAGNESTGKIKMKRQIHSGINA
jgi:hypothetical protein